MNDDSDYDDDRERTRWSRSLESRYGHHRGQDEVDRGQGREQHTYGRPLEATVPWPPLTTSVADATVVGHLPAGGALGLPVLRRSSRARRAPGAFNAVTMETRGRCTAGARGTAIATPTAVAQAAAPLAVATDTPVNRSAQRKRGRLCKADECDNYIVLKGLCCRHGGGKRCSVDDCGASAKRKGLCWRHGGSTDCKVDGCTKKAKAKGVCWSHGGGTQCHHTDCTKIAVTNRLCWAHGGGKRCIHDGCQRPAYERTHNFCEKHYSELRHIDYYEV